MTNKFLLFTHYYFFFRQLYPEFEETEDKYAKPNDPQLIEEAIKFIVAKFKSVYHTHSSAPVSFLFIF